MNYSTAHISLDELGEIKVRFKWQNYEGCRLDVISAEINGEDVENEIDELGYDLDMILWGWLEENEIQ